MKIGNVLFWVFVAFIVVCSSIMLTDIVTSTFQ